MVEVARAAARTSVLDASGYVVARRQATVAAEVTGKLTEVLVEEGLAVDEGQVLARMDDATEQAQLELARARLNAARSTLAEIAAELENARRTRVRQRELKQRDLSSQSALDQAETAVASLRSPACCTARADRRGRTRSRVAAAAARRADHPRAVCRHRDRARRPGRRNGVSDLCRRRLYPHRHLHDCRHGLAGNRGRRQRGLHRSGHDRPVCGCAPGCLPGVADSSAGQGGGARGRSAEGHGARAGSAGTT